MLSQTGFITPTHSLKSCRVLVRPESSQNLYFGM
ncbi:uncharacterized protein METZ01_LOCUS61850, partial [marine metagenome]